MSPRHADLWGCGTPGAPVPPHPLPCLVCGQEESSPQRKTCPENAEEDLGSWRGSKQSRGRQSLAEKLLGAGSTAASVPADPSALKRTCAHPDFAVHFSPS